MVLKELKNFACKKLSSPVLKIYIRQKIPFIEEGNNPSNNPSFKIILKSNSFNNINNNTKLKLKIDI